MSTTKTENKELAHTLPREIIIEGNLDLVDEYSADDYVGRMSFLPESVDREELKEAATMLHTEFSDLELTVEEVVSEGDKVVRRDRTTCTHEGEFMGIEPTGKEVEIRVIAIVRFEDGTVVDERYQADDLGLMEQLGVVEPPEE